MITQYSLLKIQYTSGKAEAFSDQPSSFLQSYVCCRCQGSMINGSVSSNGVMTRVPKGYYDRW